MLVWMKKIGNLVNLSNLIIKLYVFPRVSKTKNKHLILEYNITRLYD